MERERERVLVLVVAIVAGVTPSSSFPIKYLPPCGESNTTFEMRGVRRAEREPGGKNSASTVTVTLEKGSVATMTSVVEPFRRIVGIVVVCRLFLLVSRREVLLTVTKIASRNSLFAGSSHIIVA